MTRRRVLALIQAGGVGGWMDVLTRERAKPALPFAGVHQLVDFPLSNLTHFARGNADELFRFRDQLVAFDPDVVS